LDDPAVSYAPRPDATPNGEASALAGVYRFILDCRETRKKAGGSNAGDGAKGPKHDRPTPQILPR